MEGAGMGRSCPRSASPHRLAAPRPALSGGLWRISAGKRADEQADE